MENKFSFKGEIAEILNNKSSVKARVMCEPGILIIEIPLIYDYKLGDEVLISGSLICEKIENIDY